MSGPLGCSHHCTPCAAAKARRRARSARVSGSRWRSTSAVTRVADGQFDLRQSVALVHRADQFAQRHQQCAHVRRQHGAAAACRPRSSTCARGSRPAPCPSCARIAPTGAPGSGSRRPAPRSGAAPASGPHLGQVPEVVLEHALLDRHLRRPDADAASCSRRRRRRAGRSAGRPARRAASSRGAAPSASPVPSCSCAASTRTCTCSPGSAPSMKTTLPSPLRATPCASRSSDSTVSHSFAIALCHGRGLSRRAALLMHNQRRALRRGDLHHDQGHRQTSSRLAACCSSPRPTRSTSTCWRRSPLSHFNDADNKLLHGGDRQGARRRRRRRGDAWKNERTPASGVVTPQQDLCFRQV